MIRLVVIAIVAAFLIIKAATPTGPPPIAQIAPDAIETRSEDACKLAGRISEIRRAFSGEMTPTRCRCVLSTLIRTTGRNSTAQLLEAARNVKDASLFNLFPDQTPRRVLDDLAKANSLLIRNATTNCA